MKRIYAMLLALVTILSLAACTPSGGAAYDARHRFEESTANISQLKGSEEGLSQKQIDWAVNGIEQAVVKAYEAKFGGKVQAAKLELNYNIFNQCQAVVHILAMDDGEEEYHRLKYKYPDILWAAFNYQDFLGEFWDIWFAEMILNRLVTSEVEINLLGNWDLVEDFTKNERSAEELKARLESGELETAYEQAVSYVNLNLNVQGYELNVAEVYWQSASWVNGEAYAAKCDGREFVRPTEVLWLVSTDGRVLAFEVQQGAVNEDLCYLRHADPEYEVFLLQFNSTDGTIIADYPPIAVSWFEELLDINPMNGIE